jgi:hypothetical protein
MNKPEPEKSSCSTKDGRAVVPPRSGLRLSRIFFFLLVLCGVFGVLWIGKAQGRGGHSSQSAPASQRPTNGQSEADSSVFTPAHRSLGEAVRDFFEVYPAPTQPIAFNHKIHLAKGMKCTACHAGVTQGPDAGIPSVAFCMACHQVIASNKPEIKKLAAYAAKGQDVPWQRVYWFYPSSHVRFWHAPHISAGVDCSVCHGDMSQQTVAVRAKNLTMSFCLSCHRQKAASVDCTTCHE